MPAGAFMPRRLVNFLLVTDGETTGGFLAMNIASLILRPDLGSCLDCFPELQAPIELWSSSPISCAGNLFPFPGHACGHPETSITGRASF